MAIFDSSIFLSANFIDKIKDYLDIMKIHNKSGKIVQGKNPLFEDANASVWYDGK